MNDLPACCHAILPAAGTGSRMGAGVPKQYLPLAGATLLEHSLRALLASPRLATVVVVLHPDDNRAAGLSLLDDSRVRRVTGGERRCDSVLAGLDALAGWAEGSDWVLVHDAARPCLRIGDIESLVAAVTAAGIGGLLAEPVVDTVKLAGDDGLVASTLDRDRLWRAQTPQMFRLEELRRSLRDALERGLAVTDEASAMELAGLPVQLVRGPGSNIKVTVPDDLPLAAWYLGRQGELSQSPGEEL